MTTYPFTSALVTGASSGIGEAFAELLGGAQIPTIVVARRADRLAALAERFASIEVMAADLTDPTDLARIEQRCASTDEPVDLVVNNAGFGTSGRFDTLDVDRLSEEIALNVTALTRLSHAALSAMRARHRGYLLNVSSVISFQASPMLAVYAATKAYVTSLTEALHEESRGTGVHVTALCPGLTRTEFSSVSGDDESAAMPAFAYQSAEEVARVGLADVVRGRTLSIPGPLNKSLVATSGALPRSLVRRIVAATQTRRRSDHD